MFFCFIFPLFVYSIIGAILQSVGHWLFIYKLCFHLIREVAQYSFSSLSYVCLFQCTLTLFLLLLYLCILYMLLFFISFLFFYLLFIPIFPWFFLYHFLNLIKEHSFVLVNSCIRFFLVIWYRFHVDFFNKFSSSFRFFSNDDLILHSTRLWSNFMFTEVSNLTSNICIEWMDMLRG